jgi:hypothetical protein
VRNLSDLVAAPAFQPMKITASARASDINLRIVP